jgi:type I restriction enzyme S subunit
MARAKQQELTLDEKLEQALAPEDEWPYEVPGNWVWTRLGNVTKIIGGGTPSSSQPEFYENGHIPWICPADLSGYNDVYISNGKKNITTLGLQKSSARLLPKGTVLLSSRAPIGYVAIALNELCTNQGFKSFLPTKIYISEYLYWYLKSCKEKLESYASGTTFLELSGSKAALVEFPIAPLTEQQRIVDRIESLFAKLDQAKELAQNALDTFETRKAAILHKAFTGELTAKWREKNGVGMESWGEKSLKEVCLLITDGTHQTPTYSDEGYVFLSSKNVTSGKIDWDNVKYIPKELHDQLYSRLAPQVNDILLAKNGTTGVAAIVDRDCIFDIYVSLALLRPRKEVILPEFLLYSINNPITKEKFDGELTGIGLQNLHLRDIRATVISLPSLSEQHEIVRILDGLFEKEQKAKELCEVIDKIDLMKKAILARAFRGELGTNDPREESAVELLKECLGQPSN